MVALPPPRWRLDADARGAGEHRVADLSDEDLIDFVDDDALEVESIRSEDVAIQTEGCRPFQEEEIDTKGFSFSSSRPTSSTYPRPFSQARFAFEPSGGAAGGGSPSGGRPATATVAWTSPRGGRGKDAAASPALFRATGRDDVSSCTTACPSSTIGGGSFSSSWQMPSTCLEIPGLASLPIGCASDDGSTSLFGMLQRPWTTDRPRPPTAWDGGALEPSLASHPTILLSSSVRPTSPSQLSRRSDPTAGRRGMRHWELRVVAAQLLTEVRRAARSVALAPLLSHGSLSPSNASGRPEDDRPFQCQVCFEQLSALQRLSLGDCKSLDHGCCIDCAANFFRSRIEQGRVFELFCPIGCASGGCQRPAPRGPARSSSGLGPADLEAAFPEPDAAASEAVGAGPDNSPAAASQEEVARVLAHDPEMLRRYRRFLQTKIDPMLRECPDCWSLCSPVFGEDGETPIAGMVCDSCGCEFCYFHAAAHRGGSCEEYEKRLRLESKGITDALGTKDCPRCQRQTMKLGGCNHMTCQVCRCDWCWICGVSPTQRGPHGEDPMYWHFCDENVESGCQQFVDAEEHPDADTVRLWRTSQRPGAIVRALTLPASIVTILMVIVSAFFAFTLWFIVYISAISVLSSFCVGVRGLRGLAASCGAKGALLCGHSSTEECEAGLWQLLVKVTLYPAVAIGIVTFVIPFIIFSLAWAVISAAPWSILFFLSQVPLVRRCVPATGWHHLRYVAVTPSRAVRQFTAGIYARLTAPEDPVGVAQL
eukprot:TRINITY_DN28426_c0_g1_i1.p1 TRINITY_DN28426_c0_g1~~TRINITY_DN28426_c0_g1_i1.p1  ORF type:complete len:765 (+),score=113.18 TRINITY_DN28426_c0_g1_i1:118-2412(+)